MLFNLENIQYKYEDKVFLKELSLTIECGNHLLIHGRSGSGKSTLINLMTGLLRAISGSITFENINYNTLTDSDLDVLRSKNFGFIFQRLHLIGHLNVKQNISIAINKNNCLCTEELIKDLGLEKLRNKKKVI